MYQIPAYNKQFDLEFLVCYTYECSTVPIKQSQVTTYVGVDLSGLHKGQCVDKFWDSEGERERS